jgi:CheY-like chemotaxis protein
MPCRILIVDDYPEAAEILERWLKRSGNEIKTATDGLQALRTAEEFLPDVMLLDMDIPKLSGFEVAYRIRQQPWGRNMIVIGLTGWLALEERQRGENACFDAFLLKPVTYAQLSALLTDFLPSNKEH